MMMGKFVGVEINLLPLSIITNLEMVMMKYTYHLMVFLGGMLELVELDLAEFHMGLGDII